MSDTKTIDARGLSCPQPALLARQALQKAGKGTIEVLVDTTTALENVTRLAKNTGWTVNIEKQPQETYRLVLKK
jgi:tRNA 2-thiouridine synthesizing protein A